MTPHTQPGDLSLEPWERLHLNKRADDLVPLILTLLRAGLRNGCYSAEDIAGFFCAKPQTVKSFDIQTKLTYDVFVSRHYDAYSVLINAIDTGTTPNWEAVKTLPGITKKKLAALLQTHKEKRK